MFSIPTRDAATHMASRVKVFHLPVGIKHHFLELDQILSLLQEDLLCPAVRRKKWHYEVPFLRSRLSPFLLTFLQPQALLP